MQCSEFEEHLGNLQKTSRERLKSLRITFEKPPELRNNPVADAQYRPCTQRSKNLSSSAETFESNIAAGKLV